MENIEIKCTYPDHRRAEQLAWDTLDANFAGVLDQSDTYFHVTTGRLKLRRNRWRSLSVDPPPPDSFELIAYRRPDRATARSSRYDLLPLADGPRTLKILSAALGVKVRVHKVRKVYLKDNLRIHIDAVRGLGRFLEFELVVSGDHPRAECRRHMQQLLALFGIARGDLIRHSYSDLLLEQRRA